MARALRFFGLIIANLVIALIGTAILDTTLGKLFTARSLNGVLWKEWMLSIACAFLLGFQVSVKWRSRATKWTWVIPAAWFVFGFVFAAGSGRLWFQFSGAGCADGLGSMTCRNFILFMIPLLRGVSYSVGAVASSRILDSRSASQPVVSSRSAGM